jgi:hypothetical protein
VAAALARSADLRPFASAGEDTLRTLGIRSATGGTKSWRIDETFAQPLRPALDPLAGHDGGVRAVAVGERHGRSVIVSGGEDQTVRVWDLATGQPVGDPFTGHTGGVNAVATAQLAGRPVAVTGGSDATVRVWDLATGRPVGDPFTGHPGEVTAVAVAQLDGRPVVVSGRRGGTVLVWDLAAGTSVGAPFTDHSATVWAVAVGELAGQPVAVSGGADGTVRLWGPLATNVAGNDERRLTANPSRADVTSGTGQTVSYRKQRGEEDKAFTDRYAAAAEHLGHGKAAVRLAGVYALARLADDWEPHRQTCIDVLCAYLRMPYDPESPEPGEREVRLTVIRLIRDHLRPTARVSWSGRDLDFTGTVFDGGDFSGTTFSGAAVDFSGTTFSGAAVDFSGTTFSGGTVDFSGTTFSGGTVDFSGTTFSGGTVDFSGTTFSGGTVDFSGAEFSGGTVDFSGARFSGGTVDFSGARFSGGTVNLSSPDDWSVPPSHLPPSAPGLRQSPSAGHDRL